MDHLRRRWRHLRLVAAGEPTFEAEQPVMVLPLNTTDPIPGSIVQSYTGPKGATMWIVKTKSGFVHARASQISLPAKKSLRLESGAGYNRNMEKSATPVKWTQEQFGREGHVSVAEAARIAGVTPARIKKAIEAGEIAATSVWRGDSKRWFVPASEAERLGKIVSGR